MESNQFAQCDPVSVIINHGAKSGDGAGAICHFCAMREPIDFRGSCRTDTARAQLLGATQIARADKIARLSGALSGYDARLALPRARLLCARSANGWRFVSVREDLIDASRIRFRALIDAGVSCTDSVFGELRLAAVSVAAVVCTSIADRTLG